MRQVSGWIRGEQPIDRSVQAVAVVVATKPGAGPYSEGFEGRATKQKQTRADQTKLLLATSHREAMVRDLALMAVVVVVVVESSGGRVGSGSGRVWGMGSSVVVYVSGIKEN